MINLSDYYSEINQPSSPGGLQEENYDYECWKFLNWKKVSEFGLKRTGRIYRQCLDCRTKTMRASEKRKTKKEEQNSENKNPAEMDEGK